MAGRVAHQGAANSDKLEPVVATTLAPPPEWFANAGDVFPAGVRDPLLG
jgi:hypothetical protein